MAKSGNNKLTKLKSSVLKKWNSLGKSSGNSRSAIAADQEEEEYTTSGHGCQLAVYVGKSRRRYYISSHVAEHRVFQELVERCSGSSGDEVVVDCEVVLFEHLLWMLDNADPQPDSLDDIVDLYAC
ncbi:SAUR-like auxin-responsive protein family [Artemisia annua]|uniref:SAUR-like auxin-responsive protein family n=1 Tax=Artemisia annua TaxID=35608 RepID=A0A2U1PIR5_ARTAN|nr:SAUR-like auxin-responsive protein family [Artemisia annua]PWA85655.1 SAUR-like auxin-responsive protein family [Artemisia annua]